MQKEEPFSYPVRINRYLALKKYCSRREADEFIKQRAVTINGRIAVLGDVVRHSDTVVFNARIQKRAAQELVYFVYHKPAGIITHSPEQGQKSIAQSVRLPQGVVPVGRLDKASRGLIILTNDGRVTDALLNPRHNHEKEYVVTVDKPLNPAFTRKMSAGVQLEDARTKPCIVRPTGPKTFHITLTEGKKHQILRMCAALGWQVKDLERIRIMNIMLGTQGVGVLRPIEGQELKKFLVALDIPQ